MASSKNVEQPIKYVRDFYITNPETGQKTLDSRWHYDTKKNPYGPVLVENFIFPPKDKKKLKRSKK